MVDWDRRRLSVEYDYFMIDDESEGYRLHLLGHRGPVPDSFLKHNGRKFSTKDVDNDSAKTEFGGSCAQRFTGATGNSYSLKTVEMKIRPRRANNKGE